MSRFALSLLLLASLSGGAFANIPDPALSTVPPLLMVPNNPNTLPSPQGPNVLAYSVTVVGAQGPLAGVMVEIIISPAADALIAWCNGLDGRPVTPHPVITAITNAGGTATYLLSGGACIAGGQVDPYTFEVRVQGIVLASNLPIISPDAANRQGENTKESGGKNCYPLASVIGGYQTKVSLADAVYHTGPFALGEYDVCSDFDYNGMVRTGDAVIATQFIVSSNNCTCSP